MFHPSAFLLHPLGNCRPLCICGIRPASAADNLELAQRCLAGTLRPVIAGALFASLSLAVAPWVATFFRTPELTPAEGRAMVNGAVNLLHDRTGELEAIVDFHLVTKWKTAGDSLLAAVKGAGGISAFIVLADTPGLTVGPPDRKMGQRGTKTCDVHLDSVRVPAVNIIGGAPGKGSDVDGAAGGGRGGADAGHGQR